MTKNALKDFFNPFARRDAILETLRRESGGRFIIAYKALQETRRPDGSNDLGEVVEHIRTLRRDYKI